MTSHGGVKSKNVFLNKEEIKMINHEKLDCYQRSLTMIKELQKEMPTFPLGSSHLKDQLRRALISISLNIAEGASKPYPKDKRRFYAIASTL